MGVFNLHRSSSDRLFCVAPFYGLSSDNRHFANFLRQHSSKYTFHNVFSQDGGSLRSFYPGLLLWPPYEYLTVILASLIQHIADADPTENR